MNFLSSQAHLGLGCGASRGDPRYWAAHAIRSLPPQIYADPSKRLELYFRPKDPYCHPLCANRFSTSSLLLRVRRKGRRQRSAPGQDTQPDGVFHMEVLGIVSTIYKFQGTCAVIPGRLRGWAEGVAEPFSGLRVQSVQG